MYIFVKRIVSFDSYRLEKLWESSNDPLIRNGYLRKPAIKLSSSVSFLFNELFLNLSFEILGIVDDMERKINEKSRDFCDGLPRSGDCLSIISAFIELQG